MAKLTPTERITTKLPQAAQAQAAHVPTPRYGQYLRHAHNHITPAVAAMDSCFALTGAHQHGLAVGSMGGGKTCVSKTFEHTSQFSHPTSIRMPWENRFAVLNQQIPLVYCGAGA